MSAREIYTNFSNGYIVEQVPENKNVCSSWLLLPAENLWSPELRAILYIIGMLYLFIGVAIGSDVFMTSIEVITSRKRKISAWDKTNKKVVEKEVLIWNETVANLTLLALGSSAPEILLATIETVTEITTGNYKEGEGLGFYTILGSAAFNLFIITAICIMSVKSPSVKKLRLIGVFILTAIWSLLAYVWLLACVKWFSPGEIEIWEAVVTLLFFPLLVLTAYAQDHRWWIKKRNKKMFIDDNRVASEYTNGDARQNTGAGQKSPDVNRMRVQFSKQVDSVAIANYKNPNRVETAAGITADLITSPQPTYRPFARARFRHAAIRAIGGASSKSLNLPDANDVGINDATSTPNADSTGPKLLQVVAKIAENNKIYKGRKSAYMSAAAAVSFASPSYSVMENAGDLVVDVLLHRRRRINGVARIMSTEDGKFEEKETPDAVSVEYETREATAVANKDFKYTAGTLVFNEDTYKQTISVPIINDDQYNPDTDFYIILKNPVGDLSLGDPSVCRVTIIDDDKPGDFSLESSQLYADMETGDVQVLVMRKNGSDGNVSVDYATVDGSAKGGKDTNDGADYIHCNGTLEFKHNEESKSLSLKINTEAKGQKNFVVVLRNPSAGSHLDESCATVININSNPSDLTLRSYVLQQNDDTWIGQIRGAMSFGKEMDDNGEFVTPGKLEYLLHFLAFGWKILFAFVPPATALGGYPSFFLSLLVIAAITAVIEQLATLLGCAVGVEDAVTGICIIAIGTSVPDTFASRTAALHDHYADASIGNITGSNSVNVFLGLGLPWLIRSVYARVHNHKYIVTSNTIDFAVILFDSFGAACIVLLLVRRYFFGGELGGKMLWKILTSIFLLILWLTYVVVVCMKADGSYF